MTLRHPVDLGGGPPSAAPIADCRPVPPARWTTPDAFQVCGTCPSLAPCRSWSTTDPDAVAAPLVLAGLDAAARQLIARRHRPSEV